MHDVPTEILDLTDRRLINRLQDGLPINDTPYQSVADELGLSEDEVLARIRLLLERKVLSRFGPMYNAEKLGGGLALAAMEIPEADFERVNAIINALPEIAHNYQRDHRFNMWFVIATESPEGVENTAALIEQATGYHVYCMPKREEFYVGLRFAV